MARKKRTKTDTSEVTSNAVAIAEPPAAADLPPLKRPDYIDGPPTHAEGEEPTSPPETNWGNPYKRIFSSMAKGFEMGENRRFKQRVFMFSERPEQDVIEVLKEHGFTYRPAEKAWTIAANPENRRLSELLAYQFAGEAQGQAR
jgi:hypothetical protein